jgi:ABC-type branched-subunit amino acid transport system permease subunit
VSLLTIERGSAREQRLKLAGLAALAVLAVAIPFFFGPYRVSQFTLVLIYAIAVLGLNLLVGYSGQISLGHGAFFCLGAYTGAILLDKTSIPHLLTVPAAGLVCFAAGLALGLPALRLRGLYLALVTLAIAIATPVLIKRFDGLTGGSQGLTVEQPKAPASLGLADDQFLYFLALVVAVPLFWFASGIVRRNVGRALIAMRDDETAARTMGVNLATFKTRAFGLSAAFAGVRVLHAHRVVRVPRGDRGRRARHRGGRAVRGAVHRLRAGLVVGRRRGAVGRDLRRDADRVHVRVPGRHHGVAAQRLGTDRRSTRVNHREGQG